MEGFPVSAGNHLQQRCKHIDIIITCNRNTGRSCYIDSTSSHRTKYTLKLTRQHPHARTHTVDNGNRHLRPTEHPEDVSSRPGSDRHRDEVPAPGRRRRHLFHQVVSHLLITHPHARTHTVDNGNRHIRPTEHPEDVSSRPGSDRHRDEVPAPCRRRRHLFHQVVSHLLITHRCPLRTGKHRHRLVGQYLCSRQVVGASHLCINTKLPLRTGRTGS